MKIFYFTLAISFILIFPSQAENYNFNNSIVSVSTVNNSRFKKDKINKFINYFSKTEKGRVFFKQTYRRQGLFRDRINQIFKEYDIPEDLIYLSMIESAFQVDIVSSAGAVGLWQFMPSTGRIFSLRVDKWIDERRDFEKSTYAAAKYLTSLKRKFGSWELAMAGYNSGDNTVKNAIKEHKSRDFWYLSQHTFPKQTKNYIPQILAVIHISKNLSEFGFSNKIVDPIIDLERVELPPQTSLEYISKISGIDYGLLKTQEIPDYIKPNYHSFYILLKESNSKFINFLYKNGVQSYIGYSPLHSSRYGRKNDIFSKLNNTETYHKRLVRLPSHPNLKNSDIEFILKLIKKYFQN